MSGEVAYEFVDAGQSLGKLLGCLPSQQKKPEDWHYPWTRLVPTITGNAHIVMRRFRISEGGAEVFEVRLLEGFELMNIIGFDTCFYVPGQCLKKIPLSSLAGNAFSAFACGPVVLSCFVAYGVVHTWQNQEGQPSMPARVVVDVSSGEESDCRAASDDC